MDGKKDKKKKERRKWQGVVQPSLLFNYSKNKNYGDSIFKLSPSFFGVCLRDRQIARKIGIPMRNIRQACKHDFPLPLKQASPIHIQTLHTHCVCAFYLSSLLFSSVRLNSPTVTRLWLEEALLWQQWRYYCLLYNAEQYMPLKWIIHGYFYKSKTVLRQWHCCLKVLCRGDTRATLRQTKWIISPLERVANG